jgi:hypothetical protein
MLEDFKSDDHIERLRLQSQLLPITDVAKDTRTWRRINVCKIRYLPRGQMTSDPTISASYFEHNIAPAYFVEEKMFL